MTKTAKYSGLGITVRKNKQFQGSQSRMCARIICPVRTIRIFHLIIQQIVTLSKYGHDALDICHP